MAPPRHLLRVEWECARSYAEPELRGPRFRIFTKPTDAAEQVAEIHAWASHMELVSVMTPSGRSGAGVEWELVDVDALLAEHLTLDAQERIRVIRLMRERPQIQSLVGLGAGPRPKETNARNAHGYDYDDLVGPF